MSFVQCRGLKNCHYYCSGFRVFSAPLHNPKTPSSFHFFHYPYNAPIERSYCSLYLKQTSTTVQVITLDSGRVGAPGMDFTFP